MSRTQIALMDDLSALEKDVYDFFSWPDVVKPNLKPIYAFAYKFFRRQIFVRDA